MTDTSKEITLIVDYSQGLPTGVADRGGGEPHAMKGVAQKLFGAKPINPETIKANLSKALGQIEGIIAHVKNVPIANWEADSISVGLSVSAEGSIGIATAGVETTIEVSFRPK